MNKDKIQDQDTYFQNILSNLIHENNYLRYQEQTNFYDIANKLQRTVLKAFQQILNGKWMIKQQPDQVSEIIKIPLYKKLTTDVNDIEKQIQQSEQLLKQAKRQLLLQKKLQKQNKKYQNQVQKMQNSQKIKSWSQKRKLLDEKRQKLYKQKQIEIQLQEYKQKQQLLLRKQQQKQERRKSVEERLRQIEQNRYKRQQIFKATQEESKKIKLPKFKQIEKQFQKAVAQQNFQKQIIKKNHKLSFKIDHQLIKNHQKHYMDRIYQRMKQKGYSSQRTLSSQQKQLYESKFKILLKRDEEQIQRQKQRFKRRLKYQQKLEQLQINVDEDKKIKMQIAKDKARNPLKYHFLRQKNLNEYQIYMQFKQFELDIDRNELGNNYLQQVKKITEQSRLKKSNSVSGISSANQSKAFKYKNYLQQLKTNRTSFSIDKRNDNKLSLLPKQQGKQKKVNIIVEKMSNEARKFDSEIKNKKIELQKLNTFSSTIKKQQEIDEIYMKSIKAKLACLQMN